VAVNPSTRSRITTLALLAGLLAVGLAAASPFFTDRMVGTGEAYNYSLSVADAVTQMRAGIIPPLAGKTEYAFNGRIHPLRDAPYLHYLAYAVDAVTWRRLTFWQLQTISLSLSLIAAFFACYLGLRWGVGCPPFLAFLLSLVYGLSPPLLGAAYSFDLYMTVHVAVFVPLAIAACMRSCLRPSFSADAWLAAALACAWMAHPPVALWLTGAVTLVRLTAFLQHPKWDTFGRAVCAVVLGGCLASFVFVSTSSLGYPLTFFSWREGWLGVSKVFMDSLRDVFPACLLPVSRGASKGSDLQMGYVPWLLFLLTLAAMSRAKWRARIERGQTWAVAGGAMVVVSFFLLLLMPVPGLTHLMWYCLPPGVLSLTSIWPFQRLYLIAVPFVLFGAAIVLPKAFAGVRIPRPAMFCATILALAWTGYEARPFISRGRDDRWSMDATRSAYRPSNLDLTVTSYAFVQIPQTFVYGVMDPQFDYRLLRNGTEEVGSPLETALATAPAVEHGTIRLGSASAITLYPGKRYLLSFAFRFPSLDGHLQISGPKLFRIYSLPSSGGSRAFGMLDGERRAISVWTDSDKPERAEINFFVVPPAGGGGRSPALADYTLQEVDPSKLPIRLVGYLPMRISVDSPDLGCTVETPQRYIPGYEATVNGRRMTVLSSPDMQVMVPVPRGHSEVVLDYRGPFSARFTFWFCAGCWIGFFAWRLGGSWTPARPLGLVADAFRFALRNKLAALAAIAATAALAAAGVRYGRHQAYLRAVGPIEIIFKLPYGKIGGNQPLLATGHPNAGAVLFASCLDHSHIRLGADVWGQLFQSDPIEVDFSRQQELVVSDSALFPKDHPGVLALTPPEIGRLRGELDMELNGRTVILSKCNSYETTQKEILVGRTDFGSLTVPRFSGEILAVRRLPIPRQVVLPWGRSIHMQVELPEDRQGITEPLLTAVSGEVTRLCSVTYVSSTRASIAILGADGQSTGSADIHLGPKRSHSIDFTIGEPDGDQGLDMLVALDGVHLLGNVPDHPSRIPPVIGAGINLARVPDVVQRFTGPSMSAIVVGQGIAPATPETSGPVHMIVSLPAGKTGRSEPLVTTGHTGAGDFIYVTYVDDTHIKIGLDHWGGAGIASKPIRIDYGAPHEIWIEMNSLNFASSSAARSPVVVTLDGSVILSAQAKPFPSAASEVTVAENLIGGSTEDPSFSGEVDFVERLGTAAVPKPRS
jgi:hypothetical protein